MVSRPDVRHALALKDVDKYAHALGSEIGEEPSTGTKQTPGSPRDPQNGKAFSEVCLQLLFLQPCFNLPITSLTLKQQPPVLLSFHLLVYPHPNTFIYLYLSLSHMYVQSPIPGEIFKNNIIK